MVAAPEGASRPATPLVPISWGELFDKITILELKQRLLVDPARRANVAYELAALRQVRNDAGPLPQAVAPLVEELRVVNAALWQIEEDLRALEVAGSFGERFVSLARQVYHLNDRRAALKRAINLATGSALIEEKSYPLAPPG